MDKKSARWRKGKRQGKMGKKHSNAVLPRSIVGDSVNNPKHYNSSPAKCECGKRIECITVTEHMNFCLGNAMKYIWRAGEKGDKIEDLKKARWYLDREIARLEKVGK